ncbi:MAG: ATPase [Rhodothermales bacterium]|nr:ATPase [Rhodothermales bacterium]
MRFLVPLLFLTLVACSRPTDQASDSAADTPPGGLVNPAWMEGSGAVVHLFEWKWSDIAQECEDVLGPAGYAAVQVSPPSENHVVVGRPWWERYQPVSYQLETRSGTREDFADMVSRCANAGVDIYVDAVINHMSDADLEHTEVVFTGQGTAGTTFGSYSYPGLYEFDDFHHCGLTENDDIAQYSDQEQVEQCELVDLSDLDTGSAKVRETIAGYLQDLASLGVTGLRVDAAMHMGAEDLLAILQEADWGGYVYQEISQAPAAPRFLPSGAVTDFEYGFKLSEGVRDGNLSELVEGQFWMRADIPSEAAFVFVDNHDTQRHGVVLTHKDASYAMAVAMMLGTPGGRKRVMSSYAFEDPSAGPPSNALEEIIGAAGDAGLGCGDEWVCEHRWDLVRGMVGFDNATVGEDVMRLQKAGADRVAFTRGDRGWIGFNRSNEPWEVVHQTGLPGTRYCDVAAGPPSEDGCAGEAVRVDAGMVSALVPPMGVVAIHVDAQVQR